MDIQLEEGQKTVDTPWVQDIWSLITNIKSSTVFILIGNTLLNLFGNLNGI